MDLPLEIQDFADRMIAEGKQKRRKAHIRTSDNIKKNQRKKGLKNNLTHSFSFSRGHWHGAAYNKISKRRQKNKAARKSRIINRKH